MKKLRMNYDLIIDVCKIIGVVATIVGLLAYFMKKPIDKENKQKTEQRTNVIEGDVEENKKNIVSLKDEVEDLKRIVNEKRQISYSYSELSLEQQEQLLKDKFNYTSDEIDSLIYKATKRTQSYISNALGFELQNNHIKAIEYYQMALEETSILSQKAWILFSIANQYFDLQNDKESIRYYNMSIDFYDKINEKSEEDFVILGYIYNGLGMIDRKNANYLKAIENHEKALNIRENLVSKNRIKHILELSMSYNNLAIVYKRTGNLDKSIDYNDKAILIRRELASISKQPLDTFLLARTLSNLSNVYSDKGNYKEAKKRIEEAIGLILPLDGKIKRILYEENLATFYINYGRILHSLKDYKSSIKPLKTAINYYEGLMKINKGKYLEPYTGAFLNLSRSYRDMNKLDDAITMLDKAIEINKGFKIVGDSEINLADIYYNLALIYFEDRSNKLALHNFQIAYNLYTKYPQSAHAKMWAKEAKNRIDYLNGL